MPFNGSGTYSVVYNFTTEAASAPIEIAKLDGQFTDIAAALSNCILRDGTGLPTATIDFNTQRITGLGNSTTTTGPTTIAQFQSGAARTLGSVAGTNTITGSLTPALTAYTAGMQVVFTPANNNTGATTLNINSLGALDIQKHDGDALVAGDLVAGVPAFLILDSGADDWILQNPQVGLGDFARLSQANTFTAAPTIGGSSASKLNLNSPDSVGDVYISFYESNGTTRKGYVGFGNTGDDIFIVQNEESGANLDLRTTGGGAVQVNGNAITGPIASGTYTPTASTFTNLDSATPAVCQYMRVGAVVTVSGSISVDATASANTQLEITLPVSSNLSGANQLAGTGAVFGGTSASDCVRIQGQTTNDRATFNWHATTTGAVTIYFSFTYLVV